MNSRWNRILCSSVLTAAVSAGALCAQRSQTIPNTGQIITPTAPNGSRFEPLNPGLSDFPQFVAGQAATTVVSPDKKTMLILTSGYNRMYDPKTGNRLNADSNEYVFVYDISNSVPVKKQVLQAPNTYYGIVFDPSGTSFYVSGGVNDNVHIFDLTGSTWAERAGSPIALGHKAGVGIGVSPAAAGIAITADGTKIVVADYYNDSISVLTNASGTWSKTGELDLRPGVIDPANATGVPGGEYPFWVVVKDNSTAYVSSLRDREVDVVSLAGTPVVTTRIKVAGQPNKMTLNADGSKLYVAEDQTDSVDVIDTTANMVSATVAVTAPAGLLANNRAGYHGTNTNSVTLSPDGTKLYATNGNLNDVAVVDLTNSASPTVIGLIPTGWYPNSVSFNGDGSFIYVANDKSPTGANPQYCLSGCSGSNQYDLQLIKAGLQSFPTPTVSQLVSLTQRVAANNHFERALTTSQALTMDFLRSKIQHVIFIVKENKTYDQVLGDLEYGNGDPDITEFGVGTTPNEHNLARSFVALDNFYDRSEVSMDGWPWTVDAEALDVVERSTSVEYAGRGLTNDSEGTTRGVNTALPSLSARIAANPNTPNDPNLLPGTVDLTSPDAPNGTVNNGHIWNSALSAGRTVRNYGMYCDQAGYGAFIPEDRNPFSDNRKVCNSTNIALSTRSDPYFRGFDTAFPDFYREQEWAREFGQYEANGNLPNLLLVRLGRDHTGSFSTSLDGTNTPEIQIADNDYAVGLLVQTVANSKVYGGNTLIFSIEDDAQNGGDHVEAHRSIGFVAGPYVKQGQVVSTPYNTVDMVRTIEDVLGMKPLNLNDAFAVPMADVFDTSMNKWSFTAQPSALLAQTQLPIDPSLFAGLKPMSPTHDARYWAAATKGMDFRVEDDFDFDQYNHILWQGLMGDRPYPGPPSGKDLRSNRAELLSRYFQKRQSDQPAKTNGGGL